MPKKWRPNEHSQKNKITREFKMPKQVKRQFLTNLDLDTITNLNEKEAKRLLKSAFYQIEKSQREFRKAKEVSPAFKQYYGDRKNFKVPEREEGEKYYRQRLLHELEASIIFLRAKTSTLKGAREYWDDQMARLFGTVEDGVLIKNFNRTAEQDMTTEEKIRFWEGYNEFMHQTKDMYKGQSDIIQQYVAGMGFWRSSKFQAKDITEIEEFAKELSKPASQKKKKRKIHSKR